MKKIFSVIAAMVMVFTMANAQTVESSRWFENTYVGVNGGVLSPLTQNEGFWKDLRGTAGFEIGKNFTPVVGVSVEALANFNTTGANTIVDQSNLVLNGKVNLSNLFGGYKGYPRRVEVSLVPGIGWGHNYGFSGYSDAELNKVLPFGNNGYRNFLTYNAFGQIDFNLGKARALQINIKPGVVWATGAPNVGFYKDNAAVNVRVGLTWKFGSKKKQSHNFVLCPYTVTQADYDAVVAERDALKNRKPETVEVTKEVPVEKVVEKVVNVTRPAGTIITFEIGSATLKAVENAKVKAYAVQVPADATVVVTGSADSGTGSQTINQTLAEKRANVVANALKDYGVKNVVTNVAFDTNEVVEASRAAVITIE